MAAPGTWSDEFRVNALTANAQLAPVITTLAGGRFAVAYVDYSASLHYGFSDTSFTAVRVQLHNADGSLAAAPIQVNTATAFYQQAPRISATADGGFAVVYADLSTGWNSGNDDIWGEAVRMQRFDADGVKLGTETLVNTTVYGDQDYPSIASLTTGEIVVAWDNGYADDDENVFAQAFNPDGTRTGGEFRLNETLTGSQTGTDIVALPGGRYVVTWTDATGADGDGASVTARLFAADGSALTAEIQVNTASTGHQYEAKVTALAQGGFLVAWHDFSLGADTGGDDSSSLAVRAQLFDADGTRVGSEFLVNQTTTYGQYKPAVLGLADGRFLISWVDTSGGIETGGDDSDISAIRARLYEANGTPASDEFLVNQTTAGFQGEPQMTQLPDSRIVFTWTDYSYGVETGGDDTSGGAIRARILDLRTTAESWTGTDDDDQFGGTAWRDTLIGGHGDDYLSGGGSGDRLKGGTGTDRLVGGPGWDTLRGGDGYDRLDGDGGRDKLIGGGGGDVLFGGRGNDLIRGGRESDTITGGNGADRLTGGASVDVFVFEAATDSTADWAGRDTITDFDPGTDRIDLAAVDADPAAWGDDAFVFIGRNSFSGTAGELRYRLNAEASYVQADLDGDGSADMVIAFDGRPTFSVHDFVL